MFDSLTDKLGNVFKKISGNSKLTEKNIEDTLQEIRKALLEADVNFRVVKKFVEDVKSKVIGHEVIKSVNPSEMIVKIIHDELVILLGEKEVKLDLNQESTLMIVGLQGTGKTTNLAKIAKVIKDKEQLNPLIIAGDLIRPAAIEQLQVLGKEIGVEVFTKGTGVSVIDTVKEGLAYAKSNNLGPVLIDTAGRLHVDDELMQELISIKELVNPNEILLTVDAMTGQDIIQVAQKFNDDLSITGLVVTKMDGDARGGAVLSVRSITDVPVKFVGTGEKIDEFDYFFPDRMADRILGMGDVVSLVEKAQEKLDMEAAEKAAQRMMDGRFDLNDMLTQMEQMSKMGSLQSIMKMIPGLNKLTKDIDSDEAEKTMKRNRAIILSMTKEERENPDLIMSSRKNRIAKGSGTQTFEVTKLLKQFDQTKEQMRLLSRMMK